MAEGAVGDVGRYYQTPKEKQCVVCGRRDVYVSKDVVPHEYRKHFPVVMKSHTSHDVVLLCPECLNLSDTIDLKLRTKLAELCDAPVAHIRGAVKFFQVHELRKLKSAARALLMNGPKIPEARRAHLRQVVLHYCGGEELTDELLAEAANFDTTRHGEKVVHMYETEFGGLLELVKLWREHFLHEMQPKFLPEFWNVNHNANRLEIRAQDGRVDKQDLIIPGLETKVPNNVTTTASNADAC